MVSFNFMLFISVNIKQPGSIFSFGLAKTSGLELKVNSMNKLMNVLKFTKL